MIWASDKKGVERWKLWPRWREHGEVLLVTIYTMAVRPAVHVLAS